MNKIIKRILFACLLFAASAAMVSCFEDASPYGDYNDDGYTVSIKYDANGGTFTTNTSVIVDTYKVSNLEVNENGMREIALLAPENEMRGPINTFYATKSGSFLAGWYTEKTPIVDENGNPLDENGNLVSITGNPPAYIYSGKWDFANDRYELDPSKSYSAENVELTLYAAWAPEYVYEFYSLDTGDLIGRHAFNPTVSKEIKVPAWNTETGVLNMYEFPEIEGKTFDKVYLDPAGEMLVSSSSIVHSGLAGDGDAVMKLYVDMIDGEWYQIHTAEQFVDNASMSANYRILADLDFSDEIWPSFFMGGNFTGTIIGNGYKFSNISIVQTDNSLVNSGLFGQLIEGAHIENLTFENLTVTLESGSRMNGATFGTLAGTISPDAFLEDVAITNGKLLISPSALIEDSASIGLLCGNGDIKDIDISDIVCEAIPPADSYTVPIIVTVEGNLVTVSEDPDWE